MDKFGHVRSKRFACAASVDECKGNVGSIPNDIHLLKLVANEVGKQASTAGGSYLNQYSSSDNLSSTWPELTKAVTSHRRGNESELPVTTVSDQVVKEGIRRTEMEKLDVGSSASVTARGNSSDAAFKGTNYSCKTEGCSGVNNSGSVAGLEKCCVRNTGQVHMSSWRKPNNVSSCCNRTDESEYTSGGDGGVVCEEGLTRDSYLDTTGTSRTFCDPCGRKIQFVFKHMQKNLPQTSLKEQGIMVGESGNALDSRRYIQKKKALKEEKKRLREEEIRSRMLAPKGQTVRLVSRKMVEELLNSDPNNMAFSAYRAAAPEINEKEFPTVEESRKQRMRLNEGQSCGVQHVNGQERISSCAKQVKLKHVGSDAGDCLKLSSADEEVVGTTNSVSVRNRKRKDPVQINLVNLIKVGVFIA